jgi:hypothetical protein
MTIFTSTETLHWGELDLPILGLGKDWHGNPVEPMAGFSVVLDPSHLWFIANHRSPAQLHPKARPGLFQAELWQYDVAELFLADPSTGRYFEFNLAPNGAWWSCEFTAPRVRADEVDIAMPDVTTFSELAPDGAWLAAMRIPLDLLQARLDFGATTRMNVSFILGAPQAQLISATPLPGEPDFHQPEHFTQVQFTPIPR